MWKGSILAVALILITAICAMGCSAEVCDLPQAQTHCHQHSKGSSQEPAHECFHKAMSPQQTPDLAPLLSVDLASAPSLFEPGHATCALDFEHRIAASVVFSGPPLVLRL